MHWPDRCVPVFGQTLYNPEQERATIPIEEQRAVFADFVKAGKIRHLGVSNETPWGVCEWLRQAELGRLPKVVSIQDAYNLTNRTFEMGLSEVARRANVPLLAYSPLAFGHLTGKYLDGVKPQGARLTRFPSFGPRYAKVNVPEAVAAYVGLANTLGLAPATLALAFCAQQVVCRRHHHRCDRHHSVQPEHRSGRYRYSPGSQGPHRHR